MDLYTATEQAYKNGYAKGYDDGKKDAVIKTRCAKCEYSNPEVYPEGKVWCRKMFRYMKDDGYCSNGDPKE